MEGNSSTFGSAMDSTSRRADRAASAAEDQRIIARCKQGDRSAFNELMQRYEKKVYNYAYRLCSSYDEANDIAAEAFIRVYNSLANFRGDSSFITWLFRIVTNVYLDERKRKRIRPQHSLEELVELEETSVHRQVEDSGPTPAEHAETRERSEILQRAIDSLPDYQRMMIVLYHTEGRSYEEIAEMLDLPIGTVKSRLNRARLSLRDILLPEQEHFRL